MKILWVKTDFLHPTTRGGQIRTLEMLRQLHRRHEIHYVAFADPNSAEGIERSSEYCTQRYPVQPKSFSKRSLRFATLLARGSISSVPVAIQLYRSRQMRETISDLNAKHRFDAKVCDFLTPAVNIDSMSSWLLFQHNVETIIWERRAQTARTLLQRRYLADQARKMFRFERSICRAASHVVGVSQLDTELMRERFSVVHASTVATGVDTEFFKRPTHADHEFDLTFIGSMDWAPNIEGMKWFLEEVFPLIRGRKPDCRLAIVGRNPPAAIRDKEDSHVIVTGTVPDVRPYLWRSLLSIVPLHVGGGTRLKIFEAMASGTPVVSTTVGAEGLPVRHNENIRIADTASSFGEQCLSLLENAEDRKKMAEEALQLIQANFSWEQVTRSFEDVLRFAPLSMPRPA